ncbi:aryl-alcohol dehydrogenase-like predicted oxidoreductase [Frigoribacterium sp. PvP054]
MRIRSDAQVATSGLTAPPHVDSVRSSGTEGCCSTSAGQNRSSGFLSGKYRSKDDFDDSARSGFASAYLNDASVKVLQMADEIAEARDVTMPTVVAPIASARLTEQLEALLAAMTFELSADDLDRLDAEPARIPGMTTARWP